MNENPHKRAGGFLERTLANIFESIGFDVSVNSREFGFEADIIAKKDAFTILIEAKQYDNSYINVGSLLHEWSSKGKSAKADRVLVVIAGTQISEKFYNLAEQLGIFLWDERVVHELNGANTKEEMYRKVCMKLKFGEIMDRFAEIEKANLTDSQKNTLQEEAIRLNNINFKKRLTTSVKEKKGFDEQHKRTQEVFQANLLKAQKRAKIFRIVKYGLTIAVIIAIILFFYFKTSNQEIVVNDYNQTPSQNQVTISPEGKLINSCISNFSSGGIFDLKETSYQSDFSSASDWIRNNYENSALTPEQRESNINYIINNQLPKQDYPIVITSGSKRDGQLTAHGFYYCNENGLL